MPVSPDYWHAGLTCHDVVGRVVKWFRHFEDGTLGNEFAPPEIEIYYSRSQRSSDREILAIDTLMLPEDKLDGSFLMIPTGVEHFSLISTTDSSDTDERVSELIRLKNLIFPGDWLDPKAIVNGRWFKLKAEPDLPVPTNSAMLMKVLAQNGFPESKIHALAMSNPDAIGLCYATKADRLHWLLYDSKFVSPGKDGFRKRSYTMKLHEANKGNPIKLRSVSQIDPENIFRRVSGFEVATLLQKKCIVLGVGSLGSTVADELAKSGVGALTLIDNDSLEPGNVCRHRLGLNYVGRKKAESLKTELLRRNPFAEIKALDFDVLAGSEMLASEIETADLVISCLGSDPAELFVDLVCRSLDKPAVYCRSYLEGRFGEIAFASSSKDEPCLSCIASYLSSQDVAIPRPPEIPYQELVHFDGGCGTVFIPASSVDLGLVSLHCVRIALEWLQKDIRRNCNYFIVRGREFAEDQYVELKGEVREPFRVHSYRIPLSESCDHS